MADATRSGRPRNCGMLMTAKYNVAADNDVIFTNPSENILIVAMNVTGSVTGFTYDGTDYSTTGDDSTSQELPLLVVTDGAKDLTALASGAGTITLFYFVIPTVTAGYTETAFTQT